MTTTPQWHLIGTAALTALLAGCTEKGIEMMSKGRAKGRILTVDNSGDAGYYVAMDLGSDDRVHLVYYDQKNKALKYVHHSPAGLSVETVDETCRRCLFAAIRVAVGNQPHIAYFSDRTGMLTYAYRKSGVWKREPVEWGRNAGMGVRLEFDDQLGLHALYYSGDGFLKHAWRVRNPQAAGSRRADGGAKGGEKGRKTGLLPPEGTWKKERLDKANGSEKVSISFRRQPNGRFAASYFHWSGFSSELRLAIQAQDGSWSTEVIAHQNNPGKSSALFFGRQHMPKVLFREALRDRLSLAEMTAQGWESVPLITDAYNMALAIDATFNLLVGYERMVGRDPRKGHLRMALRREGKWAEYEVDPTPGSGSFLAAALTATGRPILAYFEETNKSLKLFIGE